MIYSDNGSPDYPGSLPANDSFFKSLLDDIPDMIALLDEHQCIAYANQSMGTLLKKPVTELIGQSWEQTGLDVAKLLPLQHAVQRAYEKRKRQDAYLAYTIDNTTYHFHALVVPHFTTRVLIVCRDVTHLKKYEMSLLKSQQNWQRLVNSSPDIIARFDRNLKHTFVNDTLLKQVGLPTKRFIGKDNLEIGIQPEEDARFIMQHLQRVFDSRETVHFYNSFQAPDGQKHFYVSLVPEFSVDGTTVESVIGTTRNISELKNAQLQVITQNEELLHLTNYLENLVHLVAHDLRGPVGNLATLKNLMVTCPEAEHPGYLRRMFTLIDQLKGQLDGLGELIVHQQENEHQEAITLSTTVARITEEFAYELTTYQADVTIDFAPCDEVYYSPAQWESICRNLLSNALKYRSPDRPLAVTLRTKVSRGFTQFIVQDNGIGIDLAKHHHQLFKPLKRFHAHVDGTGLGLNIISNIIERNQGYLFVSSQVDGGTTFCVAVRNRKTT